MQSFTTRAPDHPFEVDGVKYIVRGMTARDFERIVGFSTLETEAQKDDSLRGLLAERAKRARWWDVFTKTGHQAVMSLSGTNVAQLLTGWAQMPEEVPGEPSRSPE
jgi:hypothetical protein